jgi:hypothetical protein
LRSAENFMPSDGSQPEFSFFIDECIRALEKMNYDGNNKEENSFPPADLEPLIAKINIAINTFQKLDNALFLGLIQPSFFSPINITEEVLQKFNDKIRELHKTTTVFLEKILSSGMEITDEQNLLNDSYESEIESYQKIHFTFISIKKTWESVKNLFEEFESAYWNPNNVEILLKEVVEGFAQLAKQLQRREPDLTEEACEKKVSSSFLPEKIYKQEVFIDHCFRRGKLHYVKQFDPKMFNFHFHNLLEIIEKIPFALCEEEPLNVAIGRMKHFFSYLNEMQKKTVYNTVKKTLLSSQTSANLFNRLLPLSDPLERRGIMKQWIIRWNESFAQSLLKGEVGILQDCLDNYINSPWIKSNFEKNEIRYLQSSQTFQKYIQWLQEFPIEKWLSEGVRELFNRTLQERLPLVIKNFPVKFPIVPNDFTLLIQALESNIEIGFAIQLIHFIETGLENPSESFFYELKILIAIIQQDIISLKEAFTLSKKELWEPLINGSIPFDLITQFVVVSQIRSQKKIIKIEFIKKENKEAADKFYVDIHKYLAERLKRRHPEDYYNKVISIIEKMGVRGNQTFLARNGQVFIGVWDEIPQLLAKLICIYLPKEEHHLWKKHCSIVDEVNKNALSYAYAGSQEAYGLWFHLCANATKELIKVNKNWATILSTIGYWRKIIALIMRGIQVPREGVVSYAAYKRMALLDKNWPGPQLDFGAFRREEAYQTPFSRNRRLYYLRKIQGLIELFQESFSEELQSCYNSSEPFGKAKFYSFGSFEFVVYPSWISDQKKLLMIAISMPFYISSKKIIGTQLLWNWAPNLPFFSLGNYPFIYSSYCVGLWIHASKENKKILDEEIQNIFQELTKPSLNKEKTQTELARFVYLFYQSIPFIRGSGAIGIILLDCLTSLHEIELPDAPHDPRNLDCEAMCIPEMDFCKKFVLWLKGNNAFEF